jgi:hypothetical protein
MPTTVWAAPAFRLKSRHVLRFLAEAQSPVRAVEVRLFSSDTLYCMSSEPSGQVSNRFKRGSGPSELKLWLQTDDAAGVVVRWFST